MKKIGLLYLSLFVLLCFSNITWGQIAAWNNNSLTGITSGSLNATTYNANLNTTLPSLSRGSGITATSLGGGYASSGWNVASEALAKSGNLYYQVTIIPNSGYGISLTSLDEKLRRTSTGPNNYIWSYSLNGSTFTDIGSAVSFTTTTTGGDVQPTITLSGIGTLQSVSGTIYLRLYAWGASGSSGTLAFGTGAVNSLSIAGTVTLASVTPPTVTTTAVTGITSIAASSGGNVTVEGSASVTARGVVWSTSASPTVPSANSTSNGSGAGVFTSSITGLTMGTLYHVRAYATSTAGTSYGADVQFTTLGQPTLTTTSASSITMSAASSGGNITSDGGDPVTARGVVWSTSTTPTLPSVNSTSDGSGIGTFTSSISGLTDNTLYYVRAYAINTYGTAYGSQQTFTTSSIDAPTATAATNYSDNGFRANWNSVPGAVSYRLDVATSNTFGVPNLIAGYNNLMVSGTFQDVTGLSTFGQYYYRVRAVGGNSTSPNSETITVNSPLPVELSSFTSNVNERNISLNWETKTEKNSDKFVIERQTISAAWVSIGSVKAAVLSNSPKQYSFSDKNLNAGMYQYRLKMIDNDGTFNYSAVTEATVSLPKNFDLSQNYPNPFNPSTKINYSLPSDSRVTLEVYNVLGVRVAQLVNKDQSAGYYSVDFNSSSLSKSISSGVYLYKITAVDKVAGSSFTAIKKMMLLK
jgi:hypothetical protein